jgi:hypothetical protein
MIFLRRWESLSTTGCPADPLRRDDAPGLSRNARHETGRAVVRAQRTEDWDSLNVIALLPPYSTISWAQTIEDSMTRTSLYEPGRFQHDEIPIIGGSLRLAGTGLDDPKSAPKRRITAASRPAMDLIGKTR